MVQCEMCGTETGAPKTAKIEGAELQVCADCLDFGTEVSTAESSSTSTKYSTSSSSTTTSTSAASGGTGSSPAGSRSSRGPDLFDEMDVIVDDYPERIREARENRGQSQEELAQQLNEKASLIRKLERGDMQPNDAIQSKLERHLDISLSGGSSEEETEWEGSVSPGSTTLGDLVRRKD